MNSFQQFHSDNKELSINEAIEKYNELLKSFYPNLTESQFNSILERAYDLAFDHHFDYGTAFIELYNCIQDYIIHEQ